MNAIELREVANRYQGTEKYHRTTSDYFDDCQRLADGIIYYLDQQVRREMNMEPRSESDEITKLKAENEKLNRALVNLFCFTGLDCGSSGPQANTG